MPKQLGNEVIPMSCARQAGTFCPKDIYYEQISAVNLKKNKTLKHTRTDCQGCQYYAPIVKVKTFPKVIDGQERLPLF